MTSLLSRKYPNILYEHDVVKKKAISYESCQFLTECSVTKASPWQRLSQLLTEYHFKDASFNHTKSQEASLAHCKQCQYRRQNFQGGGGGGLIVPTSGLNRVNSIVQPS